SEWPFFFSSMTVTEYKGTRDADIGFFIANWQDEQTPGFVTVNGLKDHEGSNKTDKLELENLLTGTPPPKPLPAFKILKPAVTLLENRTTTFHILIENNGKWELMPENS